MKNMKQAENQQRQSRVVEERTISLELKYMVLKSTSHALHVFVFVVELLACVKLFETPWTAA